MSIAQSNRLTTALSVPHLSALIAVIVLAGPLLGCERPSEDGRGSEQSQGSPGDETPNPSSADREYPRAIPEDWEEQWEAVLEAAEARQLGRPVLRGEPTSGNGFEPLRQALADFEDINPNAFGTGFYEALRQGRELDEGLLEEVEAHNAALQRVRRALQHERVVPPTTAEGNANNLDLRLAIGAVKLMAAKASSSPPGECLAWAADAVRLAQDVGRGQGFLGQNIFTATAPTGVDAAQGCASEASGEALRAAADSWTTLAQTSPSLSDMLYWEWLYQLPRLGAVVDGQRDGGKLTPEQARKVFRYKLEKLSALRQMDELPRWEMWPKLQGIVEGVPMSEGPAGGDALMLERLAEKDLSTLRGIRKVALALQAAALRGEAEGRAGGEKQGGGQKDGQKDGQKAAWKAPAEETVHLDPGTGAPFELTWNDRESFVKVGPPEADGVKDDGAKDDAQGPDSKGEE